MKKYILLLTVLFSCAQPPRQGRIIPAEEFSAKFRNNTLAAAEVAQAKPVSGVDDSAKLRFAGYEGDNTANEVTEADSAPKAEFVETANYKAPLHYGEAGVSSSLWRESSDSADFFKDNRAWKSMDILTIVISESSEGSKAADTETKSKSTLLASISSLLGFQADITKSNPNVDLSSVVEGTTKNEYKGEGETSRKDSLKATISAIVLEVFPSGILRIEGKKIISVNAEEHTLIISGLVRPRDISATNQVESSRIANMRIDYSGEGVVSEKQGAGWILRLMDHIWPF